MNVFAFFVALLPVPVASVPAAVATVPANVAVAAAPQHAVPEHAVPEHAVPAREFVLIPAGTHVPFYGDGTSEAIEAFELDRYPVTQHDFLQFLAGNPQWRRDRIRPAFADEGYLRDWPAPMRPSDPAAPAVGTSWFAARAFCAATGGRLPTTAEWEYVAAANGERRDASRDAAFRALVLELHTRPRPERLPTVGSGAANWYGIHDLHGFVREWVLDFNSVMMSDDSRGTGSDAQLYCAAAASTARDASDYAAFLRYSFRASLSGRSTHRNLGFRCARSVQ
ncbi:MAG TPA: formylglycine-generating enzyme family protein [Longimicrobiales bacterium]|nr:formylglycine-generating enzyme family protein [Longimicrobiales bacterium]